MKKLLTLCILANILFASNDSNIGFLMNQKYVCVSTHAVVGDKTIKVQSKEDALKYPSRIYIDDKFNLHTDGNKDNFFKQKEPLVYESSDSIIMLDVDKGQRYMFRAPKNGQLKGLIFIHLCEETDNWTLIK